MISPRLATMTLSIPFAVVVFASLVTLPTTARAVELEPFGVNICFGGGTFSLSSANFPDLVGSTGVETAVMNYSETLKLDNDLNGLATGLQSARINVFDASGTRLWTRADMSVLSNEVFYAAPTINGLTVGTNVLGVETLPGFLGSSSTIVPYSTICRGSGVVNAGGQKFLFVSLGTAAYSGTLESPTDLSKLRIWILDASDGSLVFKHIIDGRANSLFLAFTSGIIDYDGDGSDELVIARSTRLSPQGDRERATLIIESYNLTTGTRENRSIVNVAHEFTNENEVGGGTR